MNALDLALANAAANAPKGEELHLENLDSIADPSQDEFISFDNELKKATLNRSNPDHYREVTFKPNPTQDKPLKAQYNPESFSARNGHQDNPQLLTDSQVEQLKQNLQPQAFREQYQKPLPKAYIVNDPEHDGLLLTKIETVIAKQDITRLRIDALANMITEVSTTISKAAAMSSEPNHKHRSLHEWDDSTLLNELVERENDLMPFYYELLKRIGSPELQSLVMSSMQGKNASMVTLARLCSALAPNPQPVQSMYETGLSPSAEQRMDEAFHATTTAQTYTQAQLDNLRFNGQSSGITVEEIAQYEHMQRNSQPDYQRVVFPARAFNPPLR